MVVILHKVGERRKEKKKREMLIFHDCIYTKYKELLLIRLSVWSWNPITTSPQALFPVALAKEVKLNLQAKKWIKWSNMDFYQKYKMGSWMWDVCMHEKWIWMNQQHQLVWHMCRKIKCLVRTYAYRLSPSVHSDILVCIYDTVKYKIVAGWFLTWELVSELLLQCWSWELEAEVQEALKLKRKWC